MDHTHWRDDEDDDAADDSSINALMETRPSRSKQHNDPKEIKTRKDRAIRGPLVDWGQARIRHGSIFTASVVECVCWRKSRVY